MTKIYLGRAERAPAPCNDDDRARTVSHAGLPLGGIQSAAIAIIHLMLGSDLYAPGGTANTNASRKSRAVPFPYLTTQHQHSNPRQVAQRNNNIRKAQLHKEVTGPAQ